MKTRMIPIGTKPAAGFRRCHHWHALAAGSLLGILLPLAAMAASSSSAASSTSAAASSLGTVVPFLKKIDLLEPLPVNGATAVVVSTSFPLEALNVYMRGVFPWVVGTATGLAVLMIIIGGLQIIISGGNESEMGKGRQRVVETLFGIGILIFSAVILNMLNAYFFRLGGT